MGWSLGDARARQARERAGPTPTNLELVDAWLKYSQTRLATITLDHYLQDVRVFLSYVGSHSLTSLKREDFWFYIEDYLASPRACKHFQSHRFGEYAPKCKKRLDLAQCGLPCAQREQVEPVTIKKHLDAIGSLYRFLARRGYIQSAVVKDVAAEWWEENRHSARARAYRRITTGEMERLIRITRQPNRRIAWAVLALTAVRASELLRMRIGPDWLNLDEGWIVVPHVPHQKRRGESKLWLTDELVSALRAYLAWRDKKVRRGPDGTPLTDQLLITPLGDPWKTYQALRRAWNEQCQRAGIMRGGEDRYHALTLHDTRHWLTTALVKATAPDYYVALYRGDKRGIVADRYTHLTDAEKRREFLRYAPRLNL